MSGVDRNLVGSCIKTVEKGALGKASETHLPCDINRKKAATQGKSVDECPVFVVY